ncbi:cupin domain-containing protein [Microbacterium sp. RD1]|uniref:cupin domain-containing protein n=1 Tax=Microbacterium sp. RD1 TaxID=3457313 RepID=UPI003FA59ECA
MTGDLAERRTVDGRLIERVPRPPLALALGLEPHPEGGWYRRTWTSPSVVDTEGGARPAATMIVFLLPAGEASGWHRVSSDEAWIWNGGGPIALQLGGSGDEPIAGNVVTLGDAGDGLEPQGTVPPGVWQRTLPAHADALATCVVSPGFDFADFTMPGVDGRTSA